MMSCLGIETTHIDGGVELSDIFDYLLRQSAKQK